MSVAQGQEALDAGRPDDAGPWSPVEPGPAPDADAVLVALPPDRLPPRIALPPRPPVPSGPAAWARALRLSTLPLPLVGGVTGGLLVARDGAARPGLLALGLGAVVAAHALAGLVRDLGDARPERAGPLRRVEAGRAALVLAGAATVALGVLVALHGALGLGLAAAAGLALLVAVSRRAGAVLGAVAGVVGGAAAVFWTTWTATGAVGTPALLGGLAAGGVVAGLVATRRAAVSGSGARLLVLVPYAAAGAGVALLALPPTCLAVALALPAARRASTAALRSDAARVVAGHARLFAVLLLAGLLATALTGAGLPTG